VNKKLQQATAAKQAKARAARIATLQTQTRRRAAALAAARKLAAAKRAAQIAARKKALEAAKPRVKMMVKGYHITATFGQGGGRWANNHTGLDFAAPIGTRIGAVMAGEVISAEFAGAYGRRVEVRHANGTVTWYCHMSEFTVSVGDHVDAGDQVGAVGVTGNTTGPHLHFEVHPGGGVAIDPMPWLHEQGLNP
jgi:murein DD-endopeptidase MepM/ murein hydrolase activator NlpD